MVPENIQTLTTEGFGISIGVGGGGGSVTQEIPERMGGWTIKITFQGDNLFIKKMLYKIKNSLGPA